MRSVQEASPPAALGLCSCWSSWYWSCHPHESVALAPTICTLVESVRSQDWVAQQLYELLVACLRGILDFAARDQGWYQAAAPRSTAPYMRCRSRHHPLQSLRIASPQAAPPRRGSPASRAVAAPASAPLAWLPSRCERAAADSRRRCRSSNRSWCADAVLSQAREGGAAWLCSSCCNSARGSDREARAARGRARRRSPLQRTGHRLRRSSPGTGKASLVAAAAAGSVVGLPEVAE